MIAFLRFVGLMNAAVWLGAVVFFSVAAGPAFASPDVEKLLGTANFPFFSGAFAQILMSRYFYFLTGCAVVALLHLMAEWLYMGRPGRRPATLLLGGLMLLVLVGGLWVTPRLKRLHVRRHATQSAPAEREAAARSFHQWQAGYHFLNLVMIGGLVVYVWRVANPSDAPRFISAVKFRG